MGTSSTEFRFTETDITIIKCLISDKQTIMINGYKLSTRIINYNIVPTL